MNNDREIIDLILQQSACESVDDENQRLMALAAQLEIYTKEGLDEVLKNKPIDKTPEEYLTLLAKRVYGKDLSTSVVEGLAEDIKGDLDASLYTDISSEVFIGSLKEVRSKLSAFSQLDISSLLRELDEEKDTTGICIIFRPNGNVRDTAPAELSNALETISAYLNFNFYPKTTTFAIVAFEWKEPVAYGKVIRTRDDVFEFLDKIGKMADTLYDM